ncbi:hypothetical protein [Pseudoclavibacter albus]|uniref:hypothetical protein n=1 Tax=Pseudoclavibacter albus TaxID=272241 RepID=UPI000826662E|nr:hypothetical protein [Pseudoclavibacter alba]
MNTELGAANVGAPNRLELNFYGQLDSSCIGFMGYSRSGSLVPELVEPCAAGATPIASIANYGASYPVPDSLDVPWAAPLAADIPVLDVMGSLTVTCTEPRALRLDLPEQHPALRPPHRSPKQHDRLAHHLK